MHELEFINLEKCFKEKTAVQSLNMRLEHGVYGLLGENGAGKTTLMRMICGILEPTQGRILCDSMEIGQMGSAYRSLLGYLPQDFGYYEDFTAYRFLNYMAALKALPEDYAKNRIDELLELVDLTAVKNKKLKTFSGGMIRRIGIAQALLNNPEILILDEPTSGLDPKERVRFRNIISSLGKNRIVILSTHIVSDVEYIADRIMIMKNGKMIRSGTEAEIAEDVKDCVWKCLVSEKEAEELNTRYIVSNLKNQGEQVELRIVSKEKPTAAAEKLDVTLEDIYLYCIQND
ncbi:MAG: ABC transporter ATP-binding protein [Roseburia sp.]|nr:ABC transporter ATP-binding protein [Roseburia sp.]MCM1241221.1 ABC transporter ATP-binding protein [Roseburia sp.]